MAALSNRPSCLQQASETVGLHVAHFGCTTNSGVTQPPQTDFALQTFGWLLAVLQISLGPGLPEGIALPQVVCYDELEGMDSIMWLGMENAIIVNDRFHIPMRSLSDFCANLSV